MPHITNISSVEIQKGAITPLRTRKAPYTLYIHGALLVLNGTSLNIDSALLVLNGTSLNIDSALLVLNGTSLNIDSALLVLNGTSLNIDSALLVLNLRYMLITHPGLDTTITKS